MTAAEQAAPAYVELQVTTNFSFLRGASQPEELVVAAAALGHPAIGIADRNSLAGVVRAHVMAKEQGIRIVVGARLDFSDAPSVLCYPADRRAYGRLCCLLTTGRRRAPKGECHLTVADLCDQAEGQVVVALAPEEREWSDDTFLRHLRRLRIVCGDRLYLAAQALYRGDDARRIARLARLADIAGVPLVASNDVHYHGRARRPLADVLACIRAKTTLAEAGSLLHPHAERHLKPAAEMARLFRAWPEALARTVEIAGRCRFSLAELAYVYPAESEAGDPQAVLERLAWEGAAMRYPEGVPDKVRKSLADELALIGRLGYAPYFLTVHDIVRFARSQRILCQGRGSAANSVICFCLGITEVNPMQVDLLFARFVSEERKEPPDIDVDFEHERREEVIQYIYRKYGRDRAGLTAVVISYRWRSAIRDVGKVMGLSLDTVAALARVTWGWETIDDAPKVAREAGLDADDANLIRAIGLALELIGFPRHLSQHVGGFVITRGPLSESVPIENAAMEDRTVIEWDKDDIDSLGMLKVDVLGLGMLTCIRKAFGLLQQHHGREVTLASVPQGDPQVYEMLQKADSIGVFQVESRAQMSMLPRLKPRTFYDLVIEVAIVRPGPIQGDMVHPYLRRREGKERVEYPRPELAAVLAKTCGVPLFQEQAMSIAIVAAGFTPGEADKLRRAMATFKRTGTIGHFEKKMIDGMVKNGYPRDFAVRCFKQIEGFGEYGFPESHAASFALLVYVSAWLKRHYPAAFASALINSQPMGFYAPAQIVRDAQAHGVEARPVDVNRSDWDCTLEPSGGSANRVALRLGLRLVKGLAEDAATRLVERRGAGYSSIRELWRRAELSRLSLEALAAADAFASMGLDRRKAHWEIRALGDKPLPLFAVVEGMVRPGSNLPPPDLAEEPEVALPAMPLGEALVEDYGSLGLSLKSHPAALLRGALTAEGYVPTARLAETADGSWISVAGIVLVRQRPGTASGVIFATLEDEIGIANVIVWPKVFERYRRTVLGARLLGVHGKLQREGLVVHVIAERLDDLSRHLDRLTTIDSPFEPPLTRADHIRHPGTDARGAMPKGRNFH
ncbi:error-prone DNA polymerase [Desertibaculum subflavum]|uniref:error-prone DNA polymerase n=1 Tax=Desertibaculum subflavum TaxID=2268458 RepID=UPI000E66E749